MPRRAQLASEPSSWRLHCRNRLPVDETAGAAAAARAAVVAAVARAATVRVLSSCQRMCFSLDGNRNRVIATCHADALSAEARTTGTMVASKELAR